ncbi:hypothetical protein LAZ67_12003603 [Cordylochernes scorpioides]|uniref:Alpha-galactosidase n=1 Tax=Cordylochernes scorpioides TaxID=51811 RepID=A0ABY6L609_9ARAC|nr:hypothetical protein LAZ67_12003603 [Cordylochernes scorpioides]
MCSERLFMKMADRLVQDGYKDAGYNRINIDDCWMAPSRSDRGILMADPLRFPRGIKFLADYMHARGLKLGIYADFGSRTCMGFPGTRLQDMERDVATFTSWGVDMIKMDGCHTHPNNIESGYLRMGQLLNKTGRPVVFSCSWPFYQTFRDIQPNLTKVAQTCNLWRSFIDVEISWKSIHGIMKFYGDNQQVLAKHAGPGQWNDPDMVSNGISIKLQIPTRK